ncbi:MAG: SUF system NifU family Fe-S cluster assembly protein [Candidatus Reconcilbacillus cellulovorans]|uniref:SUF system NifU family Fe-S cluster assembly protein n=1 Tax=Candidatus Reconcilbacillus cellulovorans TaxID=1906605 RepID=A0A2A6E457_9BACL|nr:MAG: SUF system NifU family Fe-S cluster assembly protein [Candidatus Reconcilbacillus cellulovorans]
MLEQLYKQIVMDHYKHPRNWGKLEHARATRTPYKNPTCGDVVVLYTEIDEQDRICDIRFEGEGCSISMASCSMMTELVKGKTLEEAEHLIRLFTEMIRFGKLPENEDELGDALALSGVHKLKARHNCSLLGWNGLDLVVRKARSEKRPAASEPTS